jgi:peptidoglycan hydrolase-like protein with peptidoglycan-binding domain
MATPPTISENAQGPEVRWAQYLLVPGSLAAAGIDGIFGAATKKAVEEFQAGRHLTADGIVGPVTWSALGGERAEPPTLAEGSHGAVVESLQRALNEGRGQFTPASSPALAVDGMYGPQTMLAVKGAQQQGGITADGTVGLQTWGLSAGAAGQTLAGLCGQTRSNDA